MKINTLLCFIFSVFTVLHAQNSSPLFFSEYGEGSGSNKYLEIYNSGSESVSLADYALARTTNGANGTFESWSDIFPNDASIAPGGVYVVAHGSADPAILAIADYTFGLPFTGDDGLALALGTQSEHIYVDWIGDFGARPSGGWPVCDDSQGTKDHTLVRKCEVTSGAEWSVSSASATCQWDIYPSNTWDSLGFHCAVLVPGCTDDAATNYSADASSDDGSCIYYTIHNVNAGNYYFTDINETVYVGDQVCWFNDGGYHDVNFAATYGNPQELVDQYLSPNSGGELGCITFNTAGSFTYNCSIGNHAAQGMVATITVVEVPGPALTIQGIMDLNAPYQSDDGKAIHLKANADIPDLSIYGFNISNNGGGSDGVEWTFPDGTSATNGDDILVYRVGADPNFFSSYFGDCFSEFEQKFTDASLSDILQQNGDDPVELFEGTDVIDNYGDVTASAMSGDPYEDSWVYRADDGTWIEPGEDGDVESDDTHSVYTSTNSYPLCPIVYGCTDTLATNYDSSANVDTGSCNYPVDVVFGCTDSTAFNFDPNATQDDESCIAVVEGCTDPTASNYAYIANTDDGTCISVVYGCLDPNALNTADSLANTDDGSCEYPPTTYALSLQGVLDLYGNSGPNGSNGDDGKAFHLKVHEDVPNLNIFSLDVVSNGSGTSNPDEFRLSGSASAGDDILIYRASGSETFMADYFGACYAEFELTINSGSNWPTQNGDDGAALFENYTLIDSLTLNDSVLFSGAMIGDPYEDSWAYRNDDGSWNFAGKDEDQDDGTYSVFTSGAPYPLCPITGCTDTTALNYNSDANEDDGSCIDFSNIPLSLQGVMDLYGSVPSNDTIYFYNSNDGKAIHLVASADIPDLSIYGLGVANNGGGTDGVEWSFPSGSSASAGDDILVYRVGSGDSSASFMSDYFGDCFSEFEQKFTDASLTVLSQSGDDAVELFLDTTQIEVFGDVDSDMSGDPYQDSWAYKNEDGSWNFAGKEADKDDGTYSVFTSGAPYPLCGVTITGCTDSTAVNYNSEADEDDGSCFDLSSVPLSLQGVMDLYGSTYGNLGYSGTDGKAIHLVATANIADLSLFSLGVANGGGSDGPEYALSGSANAGDDILVYRVGSAENSANFFADYFGACYAEFEVKIATGTFPDANGDDPIELFQGAYVVDFYGDVDSVMSGVPYEDSWAYKNVDGSWLEGGKDCDEFDNSYSVFSSGCPYPICNVQEIVGCTDTLAFNYNSFAESSDSSCIDALEDCLDEGALNYNSNANVSCPNCCEYPGCTDTTALNYDENAAQDDGSCVADSSLNYALSLQGIIDFTVPSGESDGKALHVKAIADISDLSIYGIGVANNGDGSDGKEYTFDSISVASGDDILIVRLDSAMEAYFGDCYGEFDFVLVGNTDISHNGNDAIELYEQEFVIETFGDVNTDGEGQVWEYTDSWAYKVDDAWTYGGVNCTDGSGTNAASDCPYPICGIEVSGCTDSTALNYNQIASTDDGSCEYPVSGCTETSATNYDSLATSNDGSCIYYTIHYVNAGSYYYTDITETVYVGDQVCWFNDGGFHDVNFAATYGNPQELVDQYLSPNSGGELGCITFNTAGSFTYDCSIGDHAAQGMVATITVVEVSGPALTIQGIMDLNAPSGSNDGKAIHLKANADIPDLSIYGFNNSNNGGGSDGVEWTFPDGTSATNGDDILVYRVATDPNFFSSYFGDCFSEFELTITDSVANSVLMMNGDDPMELFEGTDVIDNYGDVNASEILGDPYEDSWVYRADDGTWIEPGEDGDVESDDTHSVYTSTNPYPLCVSTDEPVGPTSQTLEIASGWDMISTYMMPNNLSIDTVLADITDNIIIVKDYLGTAYLPEWNFNGIGNIKIGQGYQIKTTMTSSLTISGDYLFPEQNPLYIGESWNMIGYLRTSPALVDLVLADLVAADNLIIAKNSLGSAFLPDWDFNGIGDLEPGKGYQLKTNSADTLYYLSNDESYGTNKMASTFTLNSSVSYFEKIPSTGNNMTLVIEDAAWELLPSIGSEIAAFDTKGNIVGSAVYSSPVSVLSVWGDDLTTSYKDGLEVSESIHLKVYQSGTLSDVKYIEWSEGSSSYAVDAINIASYIELVDEGELDYTFELFDVMPNPVNTAAKISFSTNYAENLKLSVYNLLGEEIEVVADQKFNSGIHHLNYDASKLSSGLYFYGLESETSRLIKRFNVVR